MRLRLVLTLAATLAFGALSAADLTITFTTTGKGPGGGSGGSEVHYYTGAFNLVKNDKARRDNLVDFKKGVTYAIDHKKKTIEKLSFDDAFAALDTVNAQMPEGLGAMMGALMGDPNDVKVENRGTEAVAGRTCQVWFIHVGKMDVTISADPTLKMPMPDAEYARMVQARAAQFAKAGPAGATWKRLYQEMAKVKGVPLKTHMKGFMGMDFTSEASKIDQGAIPAATFDLPAGYATEDVGKKMREGLKRK